MVRNVLNRLSEALLRVIGMSGSSRGLNNLMIGYRVARAVSA